MQLLHWFVEFNFIALSTNCYLSSVHKVIITITPEDDHTFMT
jgi:hypothetical protein